MTLVEKARAVMMRAHMGQKRKHGSPYALHPERVARELAHRMFVPVEELDERVHAMALLHDVLEDGNTTLESIRKSFGDVVAAGVGYLTRSDDETFGEYARRLSAAPPTVLMLKAADRIDNLRDAYFLSDTAWVLEYVEETRRHILPLFDKAPEIRGDIEKMASGLEDWTGRRANLLKTAVSHGEMLVLCDECGAGAGRVLYFEDAEGEGVFMAAGFPSARWERLSKSQAPLVRAAIEQKDLAALRRCERELAPFFCSQCGCSYCDDHIRTRSVFDDGFYDCAYGICPSGHEWKTDD